MIRIILHYTYIISAAVAPAGRGCSWLVLVGMGFFPECLFVVVGDEFITMTTT